MLPSYVRITEIRELHWKNGLFSSCDSLTVTVHLFNCSLNPLSKSSWLNFPLILRTWHCSVLAATSAVSCLVQCASLWVDQHHDFLIVSAPVLALWSVFHTAVTGSPHKRKIKYHHFSSQIPPSFPLHVKCKLLTVAFRGLMRSGPVPALEHLLIRPLTHTAADIPARFCSLFIISLLLSQGPTLRETRFIHASLCVS